MKIRLLLGAALAAGAVLVPVAPASANTGCTHLPTREWLDPDPVTGACYTAVGLIPDALCTKYGICFG
ncbi:MAG TPA: hypothetical protein VNQ77_06060 [Frankiaceae bacterium]|nr:hypothetical protein [Frankiaceae bacterium]